MNSRTLRQQDLDNASARLGEVLARVNRRVVFAESCTCGLIAAAVAQTTGISNYLCGSFVTYRNSAKVDLLGVDEKLLEVHTAVSKPVTAQMALQSLGRSSEADLSLAVTGHLGPNVEDEMDGLVFVAVAKGDQAENAQQLWETSFRLQASNRIERQMEAATFAILELVKQLAE